MNNQVVKYWNFRDGLFNKLVVLTENELLFGNYTNSKIEKYTDSLRGNEIPNRLSGVSLNYIRTIESGLFNRRIVIELKSGELSKLTFREAINRDEVFESLKSQLIGFNSTMVNRSNNHWTRFLKNSILIAVFLAFVHWQLPYLNNTFITGGFSLSGKFYHFVIAFSEYVFGEYTLLFLGTVLFGFQAYKLIKHLKYDTSNELLRRNSR